jgi:catechol 2,3-dioxygenase-like lactoylglutathione lyase family enzyme
MAGTGPPWQTEPVQPVGVHHVAINVDDVPASVDFYTEVLGLTLRTDRPELGLAGAWLDAGGQQVHLLEAPVPRNLGQHFALWFDDLDGVVAELRGKGVEVSDPGGIGAGRQAFLLDPSGNAVELHQRV